MYAQCYYKATILVLSIYSLTSKLSNSAVTKIPAVTALLESIISWITVLSQIISGLVLMSGPV